MSRDSRSRRFGWTLVGALAIVATLVGGAVAPKASGAVPTVGSASGGTPDQKRVLTAEEKAHIREIRRSGRERGLTEAQIRAEVHAYLKSLHREKKVKGAH
jgi:hypothetical protein